MGSGQSGESLFLVGLEVYVDSDGDVDCLDFNLDDFDVDPGVEPELDDSVDLAKVVDIEDQEVMVASIEHMVDMDVDNRAPEVELVKL